MIVHQFLIVNVSKQQWTAHVLMVIPLYHPEKMVKQLGMVYYCFANIHYHAFLECMDQISAEK